VVKGIHYSGRPFLGFQLAVDHPSSWRNSNSAIESMASVFDNAVAGLLYSAETRLLASAARFEFDNIGRGPANAVFSSLVGSNNDTRRWCRHQCEWCAGDGIGT
jgi:hypothetical protein